MNRVLIGLILGIFLIGLIGVVSAEDVNCSSNNLSLCLNETSCEGVGGHWDSNTCSECPVIPLSQWCPDCDVEEEGNDCLCPMKAQEDGCSVWDCDSCEVDDDNNETEVQVCSTITSQTLCEAKKNCEYNNATGKCVKTTKIKELKASLQAYLGSNECPEDCVCAGSTIKCETENGRTMTVVAGKSGNIIIQTKTANASTSVILIKNSTGLYGNFTGKVKKIKYLPDEIKERVLKKLKITNATSYNMTLKEDGSYEMTIDGKYRVLWIFPKKTIVVTGINSETGEVVVLKKPWWKFRAD